VRRYRFGRPAALAVIVFMALVVVTGALAVSGRDDDPIWWLLVHVPKGQPEPYGWWYVILILAGGVQGWALWQILRGRLAGERPAPGRYVPWLRAALYVELAGWPLSLAGLPSWTYLVFGLAHLAVVVLFLLALDGASRALRLAMLVTGALSAVSGLGHDLADTFGLQGLGAAAGVAGLGGVAWLLWMALTLVAQARDGRWGRTTVWAGAVSVAFPGLVAPMSFFSYVPLDTSDAFGMILAVTQAIRLFDQVWLARSAHDLGNPPPRPDSPRPATASSAWRPFAAASSVWSPLAVVAVLLPVLPAAVNLAQGASLYIGSRGGISATITGMSPGSQLGTIWSCLDLAVGAGAPAVLVLLAVRRGTRRFVRGTVLALVLAAAAGVASVAMGSPRGDIMTFVQFGGADPFTGGLGSLYAGGEAGVVQPGISPLWYALALVGSALILAFLYGEAPARRRPYQVVAAGLTTALAVCLLAAADHAPGPVTTAGDCHPAGSVPDYVDPPIPPMTPEQVFVCAARDSRLLPYAGTAPDTVLLAHGRRLCGVYTRDDPAEIARVRAAEGVRVRDLTYLLGGVCPAAAAVVDAGEEEEEQELRASEAAERRVCDEAPRHHPLIRPVSRIVERKPVWTDYGVLESVEPGDGGEDDYDAGLIEEMNDNGLVAARGGQLVIGVWADAPVCVTTETYTRRPPVETRGWDHVVEVGYLSTEGDFTLSDPMSDAPLPNLAVRGKGHYRVRVHYDRLPDVEGGFGGQRLLVMAYPGRGDQVVVHRKR
jgi:hypothetical protein